MKKTGKNPLYKSFGYAFEGIFAGIRGERNMKIHCFAAVCVVVAGVLYHISVTESCICLVLFGLNLSLELVNTAIEAVVDLVTEDKKALANLAKEAQLTEKFEALYNGAVINTGENRLVLHQLTRGQLGDAVVADGVDKRKFYVEQQERIAEFANKVHSGEITNAAGEKFTTVVQIGIGGSDLGPRAMYLALENWAKKNNTFKMEAKFISNVDNDDAASELASDDVAHSNY